MERGGGIGGEKGKIKVEEGKEEGGGEGVFTKKDHQEEEERKEEEMKKKGISSKNKEFKFIQSE